MSGHNIEGFKDSPPAGTVFFLIRDDLSQDARNNKTIKKTNLN